MTDLVIVAIPRDNDPVWKYSSEKVPHMTLLYLGEQTDDFDIQHVAEYLEHVVEGLEPFGLDVDFRGPLGPDEADVLFFHKNGYGSETPKSIRSYLLQDPYIRTAYDSQEQYPEWTPHLTMGYPATPAKPDNREYGGFSWVQFDRVALWTGDSVGPTYRLEYKYNENPLAMSDTALDFLAHFGVKGMHWGVRRTPAQLNTNAETVHVHGEKTKVSPLNAITKGGKYAKANADTAVTVAHRPGERVTTKGGSNRPAHEDAVKVAVNKRIARSSTTDALSTKDLQDLVNRMNLEQQYSRLTAEPENQLIKAGKAMLGDLVRTEGNRLSKQILNDKMIEKGLRPESEKEREQRLTRQAKFKKTVDGLGKPKK